MHTKKKQVTSNAVTIRRSKSRLRKVFTVLLLALAVFFITTARWAFTMWSNLKLEEIIYELSTPLQGTGSGIIRSFLLCCILPTVIAAVLMILFLVRKKGKALAVSNWIMILSGVGIASAFFTAWFRLDVTSYLKNANTDSTFIEDNYADPKNVTLTFPEKKRNLIYIYLESMEMTYADEDNGGGFTFNCIPELTSLAEENEDFSGSETTLNGAYAMNGATWTMGGIFAATSGLPLKTGLGNNAMVGQSQFFPSITTLGDILKDQGYNQVFMCGSDATFGGRKLYFTEHGDYTIYDYIYARDNGWIPSNYKVWWGFEDKKLFSFAMEQLTKLASEDEPFNFTMLTVDTHFPNGYVCDLCPTTFGSNQYANVMACSSAQVAEFINWIKQQDFYSNTTIVISGDHLTMDGDFCNDVSSDYNRRVYTCYLNSAVTPEDPDKKRTFTTFDNFPTTLAAMGVKIDGNQLGLGTNLFSSVPTLTEKNSVSEVNTQLARKSSFMEEKSGVSAHSLAVAADLAKTKPKTSVSVDGGRVTFTVSNLDKYNDEIRHLYLSVYNEAGERILMQSCTLMTDGTWQLTLERYRLQGGTKFQTRLHVDSDAGDVYIDNGTDITIPGD